jgi:hypothetical protein
VLGGFAIPDDGLSRVLPHALAERVHPAEMELGFRIPLIGQRAQEPHRRREVALPIGGHAVLERPR